MEFEENSLAKHSAISDVDDNTSNSLRECGLKIYSYSEQSSKSACIVYNHSCQRLSVILFYKEIVHLF